jgi:hypothetical protein
MVRSTRAYLRWEGVWIGYVTQQQQQQNKKQIHYNGII